MFADIIIDIQSEKLDRVFEYEIPKGLEEKIRVGSFVNIPFGQGNHIRKGYVVNISPTRRFFSGEIKAIEGLSEKSTDVEADLVELAAWMADYYGATFLQALKTVIPVKVKVAQKSKKTYTTPLERMQIIALASKYHKDRRFSARARIMDAFLEVDEMTQEFMELELKISPSTINSMISAGEMEERKETIFRNRVYDVSEVSQVDILNDDQKYVRDSILKKYDEGLRKPSCIHGITGSGKTQVYISLAEQMIRRGKQVIVLIPEISLTAQTVMRFYKQFGDRVSFVHSRLSKGERYDQYVRAKNGDIDIMIGPRSALFTPFGNLGMIIVDEEHDGAYLSEQVPRYNAIEVAKKRAKNCGGIVVTGSATPSMETYFRCMEADVDLYELKERAVVGAKLATTTVVDMREELKAKNRSIFSRKLQEEIESALSKNEQIMLFLNRRGYAGFVSCRSCGSVFQCPHCDISLTIHKDGTLKCHYCGYEIRKPEHCPECGSPYIAGFGLGTERIEEELCQMFPGVRTLIMDRDTTQKKNSMDEILAAFSSHEADVLIGTQMIVKGHDFPNVTVMGIIAADMTLNLGDYRSSERTFALLTQAAGRAGRARKEGQVIIQTYRPEHYVIEAAANQDYKSFFENELAFRRAFGYPPCGRMLEVTLYGDEKEKLSQFSSGCLEKIRSIAGENGKVLAKDDKGLMKINDIYRNSTYVKSADRQVLETVKNELLRYLESQNPKNIWISFDFQ